jgi:hypothetical protein
VLVTGGGLGWIMYRARVQRDAVAAIYRAGGCAYYDWQLREVTLKDFDVLLPVPKGVPGLKKWLGGWFDVDYFCTVRYVVIPGPADADPLMPVIGQLQDLQELKIGPAVPLSDAGMAHLRGLTRLKMLQLPNNDHSRITGLGLKHIEGLFRLQRLSLENLPLTDAELAPIRRLTDLRALDGLSPKLTDSGMSNLSPLANLRMLDLSWTRITRTGLVSLRRMPRLWHLSLEGTQVTDEALPILAGHPCLTSVRLLHSAVTEVGLAKYRDDRLRKRVVR